MEAATVRYVSASWLPSEERICLRIESDELDEAQRFLISLSDIEPLVTLLLVLGGKARAASPPDTAAFDRGTVPLPVDALGLGESAGGAPVIHVSIGPAALAFELPATATQRLGQSLLALSATTSTGSA